MNDTLEKKSLNNGDRCDRCGSQAYFQVWFDNGLDLMFCSHHHQEHKNVLEQIALTTLDESAKIR